MIILYKHTWKIENIRNEEYDTDNTNTYVQTQPRSRNMSLERHDAKSLSSKISQRDESEKRRKKNAQFRKQQNEKNRNPTQKNTCIKRQISMPYIQHIQLRICDRKFWKWPLLFSNKLEKKDFFEVSFYTFSEIREGRTKNGFVERFGALL